MAYVPGLNHDLFLSYDHDDLPWVDEFQEQLTERLRLRLGGECAAWQDTNKLRTGQNWPNQLEEAIRRSAAFVAILSRSYYGSIWCEKELETFLHEARNTGEVEAGGYGRVMKVIKFPWRNNTHEGFHPEYQQVPFFDRDAKTGQEREFKPNSQAFRKAVDKLSYHIEQLFEAMLRGKEKVFVARSAEDAREIRESLVRQIKAEGYALSPPPDGVIIKGLDHKTLRDFINDAGATVHLLGATYDPVVRDQILIARDAGKKLIFCLLRGHETAAGEQRKLIDEIRENKLTLPEGTWSLLQSRSPQTMVQDLIALLAPQRESGSCDGGTARVYLMCDPTTPEDANFAREVQWKMREQEKIQVDLPVPAGDSISPAVEHERLLADSDGVLLYWQKAPANWYSRNVADLLMAETRTRKRELKSKALLVGGLSVALPGLTVIEKQNPFDIRQLEPFLAPLRGSRYGADLHVSA